MLITKLCEVRASSRLLASVISVLVVLTLLTGCRRQAWRRGSPDSANSGLAPFIAEDSPHDCSVPVGKSPSNREGCVEGHLQHFSLAFVEFDDVGELWSIGNQRWDRSTSVGKWPKSQLENAVELVDAERTIAQQDHRRLIVLTFVHGWHNDAGPNDETHNQNLNSFKHSLEYLATHSPGQSKCAGSDCPVVVGIFLAWRGKLVQNDFLHVFTYANRRNAANRVGGVSLTEAVMLLALTAKGAPPPYDEANQCQQPDETSRAELNAHRQSLLDSGIILPPDPPPTQFFLVGHSFGGRALLHGTAQAMLSLILEQKAQAETCVADWNIRHGDRPLDHAVVVAPIDLIAFINPADDAFATKSLVEAFKRNGITADEVDHPFMLSIKADGDVATGPVMEIGQTLAGDKPYMHSYDRGVVHPGLTVSGNAVPAHPSACEEGQLGLKTQVWYYKHSAGGTFNMASHLIADFGLSSSAAACPTTLPTLPGETFVWAPSGPEENSPGVCLAIIPVKTILQTDNGAYSKDKSTFTVSPQQFYSCPPSLVDGDHRYVGPWNDTPFFIMHAPKALIPNHDDIFRLGVFNLLVQLTQKTPRPTVLNIRLTPKTMPNQGQAPMAKQPVPPSPH